MQWLQIDSKDQLSTTDEASKFLTSMPRREPLNLIAIFGSARQGKSFLMNRLAGEKGCGFKVSNQQKPCTVGVDIAAHTLKLKAFAAINDSNPSSDLSSVIKVGFVDAEGQGDRDTAYDARIACPVLLTAKCVLFNWRDSLQKDRILDLLGVMCRAAANVNNETSDVVNDKKERRGSNQRRGSKEEKRGSKAKDMIEKKVVKPFGHLHVVFRDWNFDGDSESVYEQLFGEESVDKSDTAQNEDQDQDEAEVESDSTNVSNRNSVVGARLTNVNKRNAIRKQLLDAFQSIQVVLMPPPTEKTKDLRKVLTDDLISEEFNESVKSLRSVLCQQCSTPRLWCNQELTGPRVAKLVPRVVDTLNKNELILPSSAYEAMVRSELEAASKVAQLAIKDACAIALETCSAAQGEVNKLLEEALSKTSSRGAFLRKAREDAIAQLETAIHHGIASVIELYSSEVHGNITEDRDIIEQELAKLQLWSQEDIINTKTNFNRSILWPFAITGARKRLSLLCSELEPDMPKPEASLSKSMEETLNPTILTIRHDGKEAGIGDSEIENTVSSLQDKSKLLLQEMYEVNGKVKEDKLKNKPATKGCCILS